MNFLKQWVWVLFGVAFLNANALGAHLHLCLDGKDPRSSLHVLDRPTNLHADASEQHNDMDVKLGDQALAKVFKFDPSSAPPPATWAVPVVTFVEFLASPVERLEQPVSAVRYLLPPQRGPPV